MFDDRNGVSVGEKLNDTDLLGVPHRVIISEKSLEKGGVEYKQRTATQATIMVSQNVSIISVNKL